MSIKDVMNRHNITVTFGKGVTDYSIAPGYIMTRYRARVEYRGKGFSTTYYTGLGIANPNADDLMYSLIFDANCYLEAFVQGDYYAKSVGNFANNLGLNDDVEQAINAYNACKLTYRNLCSLPEDVYFDLFNAYENED